MKEETDRASELLQAHGNELELGQSSHWQRMFQHPSWESKEPGPRQGLGEFIPRTRRRVLIHHVLQTPFRRHGKGYNAFYSTWRAGRRIAKTQQRVFDLDDLRQVLTLACVRQHIRISTSTSQTLVVIGDGYGRLASLVVSTLPHSHVVLVNLTPALIVDITSLLRVWPKLPIVLAENGEMVTEGLRQNPPSVIAIRANDADLLRTMAIDGAFNISSMQEMDLGVINRYFDILRNNLSAATWFYCCNAAAKPLPDGTLVKFEDYPWNP